MCSRYSLTSPPEAVRAYFGYADTPNFHARYNIAPTQPSSVVESDREGVRSYTVCRSVRERQGGCAPLKANALRPVAIFRQGPEVLSHLYQRPFGGSADQAF